MKLVFFLNNYNRMLDFDFAKVNMSNFISIGISLSKESVLYEKRFKNIFNEIVTVDYENSLLDIEEVKTTISNMMSKYKTTPPDTRIICLWEDGMLVASKIRNFFNIPGLNYSQAELFRDKIKMKKALAGAQIKTPKFIDLERSRKNKLDLFYDKLQSMLGNKFILKPKLASGSFGVKIICNYDEFIIAINEINDLDQYEAETFIEGKLYQIDSVHLNNTPIFQICCETPSNFDFQLGVPALHIPLPDDSDITIKAKELVKKVLSAFQYENGVSHLEFFVNNSQELIFLEIAARTPGSNVSPIYEGMFNFNMLNADLLIQVGSQIEIDKPKYTGKYVIGGTFPIKKGIVKNLNTPTTIGETEIQWKVKKGDLLGNCESLRNSVAKILVKNNDYINAVRDYNYLLSFDLITVTT